MSQPEPKSVQRQAVLKLLLFIGFLLFTVIIFLAIDRAGWLDFLQDQARLQSIIEQLGVLGPLAIIVLLAIAIVISPIPSAPVALVAGALYGHSFGTLYVVLGSVTGAMLAFTIARELGQDYVNDKLMQHMLVKLVGSQNTLMAIVFVTRLAPFISFDVISYAAGLTCLGYGRFLLATLAGIIPISFVLAHLGSEVISGEMGSIANAILLLGLFTFVPFIVNMLRRHWGTTGMLHWTLKNLYHEPFRLLISAFGVAVAFTLVVFFDAVFEGEVEQIVAYPKHTGADFWVMQDGVSNMHMASSLVWDWKETRIQEVEGVEGVTSILYLNSVVSAGGKQWFSYVVGMNENAPRGGPWKMLQGKSSPAKGEAILPDVIARLTGLKIGDSISVLDKPLRIVGLSQDTFSMANSVTFISRQDLADIMDVTGSVSYLFVKAKADVSAASLARRITQQVQKVNAMPAVEFVRRDQEMAMQMGTEIIQIMSIIGTVLATLIVAFTAYQQVMSRQRELAITRALGFRRGQIYLSAILQTTVVTLLGFILAVIIAVTALPWIPVVEPTIHLKVTSASFVHLAGLSVLVAVLAALWPARRVARLDPLIAFQD